MCNSFNSAVEVEELKALNETGGRCQMTSRREFLSVSAVTAYGIPTAASNVNLAIANSPSSPTSQVVPGAAEVSKLFGHLPPSTWSEVKNAIAMELPQTLPNDPVTDWLKTFDKTFDQLSALAVCSAVDVNPLGQPLTPLRYEPQLYEYLLRSAGGLLDRVSAYRREMGELEIAGVKAALDYLSFQKLFPILQDLDENSSQGDRAQIMSAAQSSAAKAFQAAQGPTNIGLTAQAAGAASDSEMLANKEAERLHYLRNRSALVKEAQIALFKRHTAAGSAHNYAQRYLRLQNLVVEDLQEAFSKAFSASLGLGKVLGLSVFPHSNLQTGIPAFTTADLMVRLPAWVTTIVGSSDSQRSPDVVDALILWVRRAMRTLEKIAQYEIEQVVSVPLNQGWTGPGAFDIVTDAMVENAMANNDPSQRQGTIEFSLPRGAIPFAHNMTGLRVVGVGLSAIHDAFDAVSAEYLDGFPTKTTSTGSSSKADAAGNSSSSSVSETAAADQALKRNITIEAAIAKRARINAWLELPKQVDALGNEYARPPLLLGNVRLSGGASGDIETLILTDSSCRNFDPFSGNWRITVDDRCAVWFSSEQGKSVRSATNYYVDRTWIKGFVIHLKVRGLPKGIWSTF